MAKTEKVKRPKMTRYTFKDFENDFPTDDACLEWLKNYLYPDGIFCETCKAITKHHKVASRKSYSCQFCGHHVHPTANTIYHKSSTSMRTWFHAIYLMASTRCSISAKQLERETGVTYKTAWRMFTQIRLVLDEDHDPFTGSVEADESFFGGKAKNMHKDVKARRITGRGASGKTVVAGVLQRQGKVIANVYVKADAHTNGIEGFWSLVKNGIRGVNHSVSAKYLQTYLDEYSFRYNRRHDVTPMFESILKQVEKYQ